MRKFIMAAGVALLASIMPIAESARAQENTLRVAVNTPNVVYGPFWVGMAKGMFEKNGVKIELVSANALSTGAAMIVSNQADVLLTGVYQALRIASEGKKLSYIFNVSDMSARFNGFISKPNIKTMEDLKAKGENCRIMSLLAGTATWAILQGIVEKHGLKCSISTAGTMPNVVAAALSGQFDAAMVNAQDAYAARDTGRANILIDPVTISQAEADSYYPNKHPFVVAIGLKGNLEAKRPAVEAFIKTMREAFVVIEKSSPDELGTMMSTELSSVFQSTPAASLALGWKLQEGVFPSGDKAGYISEDGWNAAMAAASKLWGFANLDTKAENVSYSKVVDMSFFKD
jgi:NitT/TauT family transport system substrate-binding protein